MKKFQAFLILAGLLAGVAATYVIRNWDPYRDIPMVTIDRLNAFEANWYGRGLLDYRIRISASFAEERRLYDVTVRQGLLAEATTAAWDEAAGDWGAVSPAGAEDAAFFTVAGLFSTVRSSLLNEAAPREYIRLEVDAGSGVPSRVLYGPVIDAGGVMDGTELVIEVLSFEEE